MKWMFSCKDMARFHCEDRPLTLKEKLLFHMHLFICGTCKNYARKIAALSEGVKKSMRNKAEKADPEKIKKIEDEVIERLKESS